jgi:hypothetical protein
MLVVKRLDGHIGGERLHAVSANLGLDIMSTQAHKAERWHNGSKWRGDVDVLQILAQLRKLMLVAKRLDTYYGE